jgi:hypothetical protein
VTCEAKPTGFAPAVALIVVRGVAMLTIRDDMLKSLAADVQAAFVKEFIAKARSDQSSMTAAAQERCSPAVVRRGIEFAQGCGIVGRYDIERFLYVYIELVGSDRAAHAWALEIIEDPTLSGSYKVAQLEGQFALLRPTIEEGAVAGHES